jgi:hypothetical protein
VPKGVYERKPRKVRRKGPTRLPHRPPRHFVVVGMRDRLYRLLSEGARAEHVTLSRYISLMLADAFEIPESDR